MGPKKAGTTSELSLSANRQDAEANIAKLLTRLTEEFVTLQQHHEDVVREKDALIQLARSRDIVALDSVFPGKKSDELLREEGMDLDDWINSGPVELEGDPVPLDPKTMERIVSDPVAANAIIHTQHTDVPPESPNQECAAAASTQPAAEPVDGADGSELMQALRKKSPILTFQKDSTPFRAIQQIIARAKKCESDSASDAASDSASDAPMFGSEGEVDVGQLVHMEDGENKKVALQKDGMIWGVIERMISQKLDEQRSEIRRAAVEQRSVEEAVKRKFATNELWSGHVFEDKIRGLETIMERQLSGESCS